MWAAMQMDMPMVLLHLQEKEYDAIPFATFFQQCPPLIKDAGLFDELACAWYFAQPHVDTACKIVGLKLPGAVQLAKEEPRQEREVIIQVSRYYHIKVLRLALGASDLNS
jgi:hypothetical protein